MSDLSENRGRIPLPVALVVLAVFFGAMKFDAFRPLGARAVALLLPVGVVLAALAKLTDAHPTLRRVALLVGLAVIVTAELPVLRVFFGVDTVLPDMTLRLILALLGLGSVLVEAVAARRSLRARVSAWIFIALGFATYLSSLPVETEGGRELGLVFVAGIVGLWGGGLAGLILGGLAAKLAKAPAAAKS